MYYILHIIYALLLVYIVYMFRDTVHKQTLETMVFKQAIIPITQELDNNINKLIERVETLENRESITKDFFYDKTPLKDTPNRIYVSADEMSMSSQSTVRDCSFPEHIDCINCVDTPGGLTLEIPDDDISESSSGNISAKDTHVNEEADDVSEISMPDKDSPSKTTQLSSISVSKLQRMNVSQLRELALSHELADETDLWTMKKPEVLALLKEKKNQ